jgi:hypothetical protein
MDGGDSQFVTLRELGQITGLSISTLRRRVRDGSIDAVQLGGAGKRLLFPRDVLERATPLPNSKHGNSTSAPKTLPGRRPIWISGAKNSN